MSCCSRGYESLETLRQGHVMDLDGIQLIQDEGEIQPGDLYVGARNTGPHLLVAKEVIYVDESRLIDYIVPTCGAYAYNGSECVKVREAERAAFDICLDKRRQAGRLQKRR
jgi:hypothetical protein